MRKRVDHQLKQQQMSSSSSTITGKTILITGGGSGLGEAAALFLASHGANVVITGRREANLKEVASKATGGKIVPIVADVTSESDWERVVSKTLEQFGSIDGAIMNAAYEGKAWDPIDAPAEDLKQLILINVYGPVLGAKYIVPSLIKSKGTFIITSSVASAMPRTSPLNSVYSASKSATDQLVRQFSAIYLAKGVKIFGVNPVAYESEMMRKSLSTPEAKALGNDPEELAALFNPLGKVGDPLDIAVVFHKLLTNDTKYKSGDCVATLPSLQNGKPLTVEISYFYTTLLISSAFDALQQTYLTLPLNNEKGEPLSPGEAEPIRQTINANVEKVRAKFAALATAKK